MGDQAKEMAAVFALIPAVIVTAVVESANWGCLVFAVLLVTELWIIKVRRRKSIVMLIEKEM